MKLLFSIPSGYHLRELVMPLKKHLEQAQNVEAVYCITPGAKYRAQIFPTYGEKFHFFENPPDLAGHKDLLSRLRPDAVITDTVGHDSLDYPILKAAQELGINTVTFIASWDNVWKIERLKNKGFPYAIADRIIVWNEMMKEHFRRIFPDVAGNRVAVIGAPRLDYFFHENHIPSRQELYAYLGLEDTSRPLIHFSTTELYPMDYAVEAIARAAAEKVIPGNPHLYASVHPGGNMANHENLKKYGARVRYSFGRQEDAPIKEFLYNPTEEDVYMLVSLFKHTRVLINQSSSTALESMLADTPVINIKYGRPLDWWRWYRSMVYRDFRQHYRDITAGGGTVIVKNKRQLIAAAADYLAHSDKHRQQRQQTIKKMITATDGTAGAKVLAHILS